MPVRGDESPFVEEQLAILRHGVGKLRSSIGGVNSITSVGLASIAAGLMVWGFWLWVNVFPYLFGTESHIRNNWHRTYTTAFNLDLPDIYLLWIGLVGLGIGIALMIGGVMLDRYDGKRLSDQRRGVQSVKSDKHNS